MSYTLLRLVLFLAVLTLLYVVGARGLLLFGLALLASGIISFVALSRQRDAMAGMLTSRMGGFRRRLDEGARAEDED
jgi:Mn2+/Fe2+ NRAMP family transporter